MHSFSLAKDVASYLAPNLLPSTGFALPHTTTQTHSTANTSWVDRRALDYLYQSCQVLLAFTGTTPTNEQITAFANLQDATSSTGASAADYGSSTKSSLFGSTASGGAQDIAACLAYGVDLTNARRFVRLQYHFTFETASTAGVNQVTYAAPLLIFAGGERLPSTGTGENLS